MIFNHRAVSLAFFGSLALSSDSTIGGSSNVLVSAVPWPWGASTGRDNIAPSDVPPLPTHAPVVPPLTDEITTKAAGLPTDFCYNENGAKVCIYYNDDLTCSMKLNGRSFRTTLSASLCASLAAPHSSDPSSGSQPSKSPSLRPSASPIVPPIDENVLVSAASWPWGDSLPATAEDLKAKAEFVRLGATFVEGDSLPATAEDLNAKAEFVRLGATFAEAGSAPVVPPIDEITAAAVSLPKDFCYNENGAEVCLYYYDDLTCRVKLDGRSSRTILSASFCASIAAPTSSDPSMGSQPIEHLSLRPSASPIVPPTDEIIVSPPKDFCYIENGSDVCIYYYDDLKCDVKLNGRSFRTGISASFCASLAAPYSPDPSTGIQPSKSPSLRPTTSPSSQIPLVRAGPTVQLSVDAVLTATEEAEKAEATLMAAEEVQKEAEAVLKAAEEAQKEAQKSAEAATKATEQAQMEAQKATEKAKAAEVAQMEAEEAQKAAEMAADEAEKTAEEAQMEAEKAEKVTEEALMEALKALKATEEAKAEAQKASEKAKAAEKAQKEAEKAAEKAQQEAKNAAVNEGKEDTGVMLEEEEMVFLSLMYNRGDVETDSEIASLSVRQGRGRRRAHAIRRRATATKKPHRVGQRT